MILQLENISKKFGDVIAVDNISFELKAGERIGLIGGNGAGKTTISEMIAGINKPTSGTIKYGFEFKVKPQEFIGMQFQDSNYPSGLSVKDILSFSKRLHKLDLSIKDLKKYLKAFQMEDFYHRKARSLSGGQRQKLNILLAILHQPKLVILDELSTGLDISSKKDILNFTNQLLKKNNTAAILISHEMAEIKYLCDRVIVLDKGKIVRIESISKLEKENGSLDSYLEKVINGEMVNQKDGV